MSCLCESFIIIESFYLNHAVFGCTAFSVIKHHLASVGSSGEIAIITAVQEIVVKINVHCENINLNRRIVNYNVLSRNFIGCYIINFRNQCNGFIVFVKSSHVYFCGFNHVADCNIAFKSECFFAFGSGYRGFIYNCFNVRQDNCVILCYIFVNVIGGGNFCIISVNDIECICIAYIIFVKVHNGIFRDNTVCIGCGGYFLCNIALCFVAKSGCHCNHRTVFIDCGGFNCSVLICEEFGGFVCCQFGKICRMSNAVVNEIFLENFSQVDASCIDIDCRNSHCPQQCQTCDKC